MSVGICTPYIWTEASYIAVRLAQELAEMDETVSFYALDARPRRLSRRWDPYVVKASTTAFTTWAAEHHTIIWMQVPVREQITWAKRRGIRTVIFTLWQQLEKRHRKALLAADAVWAPGGFTAKLLSTQFDLSENTYLVPIDSGLPFTQKVLTRARIPVIFPLFDELARDVSLASLKTVDVLLSNFNTVDIRMPVDLRHAAPRVKEVLSGFTTKFKAHRFSLLANTPPWMRASLIAGSKLCIVASERENTGFTALTALSIGTPVAAYDVPPVSEYLRRENAALAPCDLEFSEIGAPRAVPTDAGLHETIVRLLSDPGRLEKIEQDVLIGLSRRRYAFQTGFKAGIMYDKW